MRGIKKTASILLAVIFIAAAVSCGKTTSGQVESGNVKSPFASFRDIPGVTADEIAAIEALQKNHTSFVYGMTHTTEAFINENGDVSGYAAMICEWLTGLFGIRFQPEVLAWNDLLKDLNDAELDFAGTLIMSDERKLIYHMTDSIAERQYKTMRLKDSVPLVEITRERLPRYAFLADAVHSQYVAEVTTPGSYESVWVNDYAEVHDLLERGEADAFIAIGVAEASLVAHDDMNYEDFLPLIFNPVAICTKKPELEPIISVIDKALNSGALPYLIHLYEKGHRDYLKYKLFLHLSEAEREYVASQPVVPFVANYNNYPVCFYNAREDEWQGIFFDLMDEVSSLTGLSFNLVNDENTEWPVIYGKLLNGEAALSASLIRTPEREARFIWSETSLEPDYYALISKSDYRDIKINEIQNVRVGLARSTVYITTFKQWFPDHINTVEYDSLDNAFSALERGDVDMVMATQRRLLLLTHFHELPNYKTNIVFDQPIETILGFNKDEEILCSIINKALKIVDTKRISDSWMRKTYDYRVKVAEARLPLLIGICVLFLTVLALVLSLFYHNWSERKQLSKLVTEVKAANRAKSSFLATMSHEMRTPMNAIIGMTTICKNAKDTERKEYALNKIEGAAVHLLNVINDVLDISKIEANKFEISAIEFDFEKMLQKIINIINFRIDEKHQKFNLNVDKNIPRFVVGDDHRLSQIMMNLLSNAVKFSPENGKIGLDVILSGEENGICELRITVSDNGIGMTPEQQEKLFSAFHQADNSISREFGGTGLGLSISKRIIELMGGTIWVESEFGKGAKFIFTAKVERGKKSIGSTPVSANESSEDSKDSNVEKAGRFAGKKLLVVEDVEINREIIMSLLEDTGISMDCAENGLEAVDMIVESPDKYDAILMDVQMPVMNGHEATRRIRAITTRRLKYLPIIAMTAHVFKSDIEECLEAGMDDHLGKPIDIDDVMKKLNKYLLAPELLMNRNKPKE